MDYEIQFGSIFFQTLFHMTTFRNLYKKMIESMHSINFVITLERGRERVNIRGVSIITLFKFGIYNPKTLNKQRDIDTRKSIETFFAS